MELISQVVTREFSDLLVLSVGLLSIGFVVSLFKWMNFPLYYKLN